MNEDIVNIFKLNEIMPNISLNSSIVDLDSILHRGNYIFRKEKMDHLLELYSYYIEYYGNRIQILVEEEDIVNIILEIFEKKIFFQNDWISSKIGIDAFVNKIEKANLDWELYTKYCVGRDIVLRINNVLATLDYSEKSAPYIRRIETPRSVLP